MFFLFTTNAEGRIVFRWETHQLQLLLATTRRNLCSSALSTASSTVQYSAGTGRYAAARACYNYLNSILQPEPGDQRSESHERRQTKGSATTFVYDATRQVPDLLPRSYMYSVLLVCAVDITATLPRARARTLRFPSVVLDMSHTRDAGHVEDKPELWSNIQYFKKELQLKPYFKTKQTQENSEKDRRVVMAYCRGSRPPPYSFEWAQCTHGK